MRYDPNPRVLLFSMNGQNWLQKILLFLAAAVIAILGFFFLTIALAAGAMLAAIIALRWWWLTRKLRATPVRQDTFDGEYVVIEHSRPDRSAARDQDANKS